MTEQEAVVCMDVGGTEIKAAPVGAGGRLLAPVQHFPADAGRPADALLAHFAAIALAAADLAGGRTVRGVHLAFPGPFDYENGVSRMRNLDKYDALYGVNLREVLQRRLAPLGLPGESIRFINDVSAYALGEMRFGLSATYLNFCDLVDSRVLGRRLDAMCGLLRENDIRPATAMIADINGISMGQRDVPLVYMGEMAHHPIRLCDNRPENNGRPVYSWVMNNLWETNFKMDLSGFCSFQYTLWLSDETDPEQAMAELHERTFDPYPLITG